MSKWIAFEKGSPDESKYLWLCDKDNRHKGDNGVTLAEGRVRHYQWQGETHWFTHWQYAIVPTHIDLEGEEE